MTDGHGITRVFPSHGKACIWDGYLSQQFFSLEWIAIAGLYQNGKIIPGLSGITP
jgi:hypothetical protein